MKSKLHVLLVFFIAISFSVSAIQKKNDTGKRGKKNGSMKLNPDAPEETAMLGQLAGTWNAEATVRNRDGSWSEKKVKAIWDWYYILDGHGVQDDWFTIDAAGKRHHYGTNIRIYNSDDKLWHMAWIDIHDRKLAIFTAVNENGSVIMTGISSSGRKVRNTFHDITHDSFDWYKEWTNDDGKTWFGVSRIHCTRM